jgi:hypothetical protein
VRAVKFQFAKIWLMLLLMLICYEKKNTIASLKNTAEVVVKNMEHNPKILLVRPRPWLLSPMK